MNNKIGYLKSLIWQSHVCASENYLDLKKLKIIHKYFVPFPEIEDNMTLSTLFGICTNITFCAE